ncbi:glycoside hydrolase family 68 protein [Paenibacillus sp. LMG 31458]|uniref:Glycoside hydrolase family 68 protein n=1 Tax=Paenibacillus phytorum TaxID=2654977 RepID=A0ABX1Y7C5_9BACL|nr:glycoside hydrolase family 68 protein [Paenibacillus phytorum]NOU76691.1 glycoside hydrolase family 68 protein [Paenibacillus phytorum]
MKRRFLPKFGKLVLTATILASSLVASSVSAKEASPTVPDDFTSIWSRQQAEKVALTQQNTAPKIDTNFNLVAPDQWVWDTWPLENRDGSLAIVNGYRIAFALVAPRTYSWGDRHTHARIGMFYSKNGKDWTYAGVPYNTDKALGHHQWAGTAMLDEKGKVHLFYTAVTDMNANGGKEWSDENWLQRAEQRIATTTFDINAGKDGVNLTNEGEHKIILQADGKLYETIQNFNGNSITAFRDPFFFHDPNTGKEYLIFEGQAGTNYPLTPENIGDEVYRRTHSLPAGAEKYTGMIGIAEVLDHDVTKLKLLPPLLDSIGANQQLERPHVVVKGDEYYLFTISHTFTYATGLTGPDGVYGFYGKGGIRADYKPMNGSGLVIGNPASNPYQAYSWLVLPNQQVISFINEPRDANGQVKFGGTFAPTLKISLNGDKSEITGEGKPGEIKPFGANR